MQLRQSMPVTLICGWKRVLPSVLNVTHILRLWRCAPHTMDFKMCNLGEIRQWRCPTYVVRNMNNVSSKCVIWGKKKNVSTDNYLSKRESLFIVSFVNLRNIIIAFQEIIFLILDK